MKSRGRSTAPRSGPIVLASPPTSASASLTLEARGCERCALYAHATQTVFGEGPRTRRVMFIGEQPGDQEDVIGRPFVGPAGQLLDEALEEAGIDRRLIYITNAVKHFKFTPRGRRRIHQSPSPRRDRDLPLLARRRARGREPNPDRASRRQCRPSRTGPAGRRNARTRAPIHVVGRRHRVPDRASVLSVTPAGRGVSRARTGRLRPRPARDPGIDQLRV